MTPEEFKEYTKNLIELCDLHFQVAVLTFALHYKKIRLDLESKMQEFESHA